MMDEILQAISMVGFPIVMCLLQFYFLNKTVKENTDAISSLNKLIESILTKK